MSRLTIALGLLVAVLAGGLGSTLLNRPATLDADQVRAIAAEVVSAAPKPAASPDAAAIEAMITDALAKQPAPAPAQSVAQIDAATLNPMIEDYLLKNPRILQRVSSALEAEITATRKAETKSALADLQTAIYDDPDHIVLGNPKGDVTLVEMFDYNCGYCRQALPDMAELLDEDPNLKVILKEFPILSAASVDAARVAVLVSEAKVDYWAFHEKLFTGSGQNNMDTALSAAKDLGLNPVTLQLDMNTPKVTAVLDKSYDIAKKLKITGTPTFIIGDEIIPGAVGIEALKLRISNMRACGSTTCETTGQPG
ncbi:DsbA family protein [Devosia sp.]|uniref:DsbA family protein n=1 Tax=Devosia sp. TaxID=1871048 RepID=UPI003BAA1720